MFNYSVSNLTPSQHRPVLHKITLLSLFILIFQSFLWIFMISGGNQDIYEWATEEANREDTKGIYLPSAHFFHGARENYIKYITLVLVMKMCADHWGRRGSYDEEGDGSKSSIDALLRQAFLSPKVNKLGRNLFSSSSSCNDIKFLSLVQIEQAIDSSQRTKFPHGEQQVLELHPWGRTLLLLWTCSSPWPCLEAC